MILSPKDCYRLIAHCNTVYFNFIYFIDPYTKHGIQQLKQYFFIKDGILEKSGDKTTGIPKQQPTK